MIADVSLKQALSSRHFWVLVSRCQYWNWKSPSWSLSWD